MSIEVIKTFGLRSLGILFVLAGAALLARTHGTRHEPLPACQGSDARLDDCRHAARMEHGAS